MTLNRIEGEEEEEEGNDQERKERKKDHGRRSPQGC